MIKRLLFSGALLLIMAANAVDTRLAYSKKDQVEVFVVSDSEKWCASEINLKFVGRDATYYQSEDFTTLFNKLRSIIPGECAEVNSINITALGADKITQLLAATSTDSNNWQVVSVDSAKTTKPSPEVSKEDEKVASENDFITPSSVLGEPIQKVISNNIGKYTKELAVSFARKYLESNNFDSFKYRWIYTNSEDYPSYLFINASIKEKSYYKLYYLVDGVKKITIPDNIELWLKINNSRVTAYAIEYDINTKSNPIKQDFFINFQNDNIEIDYNTELQEGLDFISYSISYPSSSRLTYGYFPVFETVQQVNEYNGSTYFFTNHGFTYQLVEKDNDIKVVSNKEQSKYPVLSIFCEVKELDDSAEQEKIEINDVLNWQGEQIKLNRNDKNYSASIEIPANQFFIINFPGDSSLKFDNMVQFEFFDNIYGYRLTKSVQSNMLFEGMPCDKGTENEMGLQLTLLAKDSEQDLAQQETSEKPTQTVKQPEAVILNEATKEATEKPSAEVIDITEIQEQQNLKWDFNGWQLTQQSLATSIKSLDLYTIKTRDEACTLYFPTYKTPAEIEFLYLEPQKEIVCTKEGILKGKGKVLINYIDGTQKYEINGYFDHGMAFSTEINSTLSYAPIYAKKDKYGYVSAILAEDKSLGAAILGSLYWDKNYLRWYLGERVDVMLLNASVLTDKDIIEKLTQVAGNAYNQIYPKQTSLSFRAWSGYLQTENGEEVILVDNERKNTDFLFSSSIRRDKDNQWSSRNQSNYYLSRLIEQKKVEAKENAELAEREAKEKVIQEELKAEKTRLELLKQQIDDNPLAETGDVKFTIDGEAPRYYLLADLVKELTEKLNGSVLTDENGQCKLYFINRNFGSDTEFLKLVPHEGIICDGEYFYGQGDVSIQYTDGRNYDVIHGFFSGGTTFDNNKLLSQQKFLGLIANADNPNLIFSLPIKSNDFYAINYIRYNRYSWTIGNNANLIYGGDKSVFESKEGIEKLFPLFAELAQTVSNLIGSDYSVNIHIYEDYEINYGTADYRRFYDSKDLMLFSQGFRKKNNSWVVEGNYKNYYLEREIRRKEEEKKRLVAEEQRIAKEKAKQQREAAKAAEEKRLAEARKIENAKYYIDCYKNAFEKISTSESIDELWIYQNAPKLINLDYISLDDFNYLRGCNSYELDSILTRTNKFDNIFTSNTVSLLVNIDSIDEKLHVEWPDYISVLDPNNYIAEPGWYVIHGRVIYEDFNDKISAGLIRPSVDVSIPPYKCIKDKCDEIFEAESLTKLVFPDIDEAKAILESTQ